MATARFDDLYREHADEIDCVVLDLAMPGMDGVQTFDALRELSSKDADIGTMRDRHDAQDPGSVSAMELEHYPGMTEQAIEAMIDEAVRRFELRAVRVIHRVGTILPGEQIVLVAVGAMHRRAAFQGCEFLMDYLKTQAPFWKKETTPDGARWVDARVADDAALARWGIEASNAEVTG